MAAAELATRRAFRKAEWRYGHSLWPLAYVASGEDPFHGAKQPPVQVPFLSEAECNAILSGVSTIPSAGTSLSAPVDDLRLADTRWIFPHDRWVWLFERVAELFCTVNDNVYGFRIQRMVDPLLVAIYPSGPGFGWHVDALDGVTATRRLSLTVPLTPPGTHSGGLLEIEPFGIDLSRATAGAATIFPSSLRHRVTPLTAGTRTALVGWAHAPAP